MDYVFYVADSTAPGGVPTKSAELSREAMLKHVIWLRDNGHTFITVTNLETGATVDDECFMRGQDA